MASLKSALGERSEGVECYSLDFDFVLVRGMTQELRLKIKN
jgi:hypothetical protein